MWTDQLGEVRGLCEVPICLRHESRFHSARAEQLRGDRAADAQGSIRRLAGERGRAARLRSRRAERGGLRGHTRARRSARSPTCPAGKGKVGRKAQRGFRPGVLRRAPHRVPSRSPRLSALSLNQSEPAAGKCCREGQRKPLRGLERGGVC